MALPFGRPQIFIASTALDLRDIRSGLKVFLTDNGFSVRISEDPDFPVLSGEHSYQACLAQVEQSSFVILLIDSRYGGTITHGGADISITRAEFRHALANKIPLRTFVRWEIWDERNRFKEFLRSLSKDAPTSPPEAFEKFRNQSPRTLCKSVAVYEFIDEVCHSQTDNWIHQFHDAGDVIEILKQQLDGVLSQLYGQGIVGESLDLLIPPQAVREILGLSTKYRSTNERIDGNLQASRLESVPRLAVVAAIHRLARTSRATFAGEMVGALDGIKSERRSRLDFFVSDTSIEMLRPDSWQHDEDHRRVLLASHAVARSVRLRRTRYQRVLMIERPQFLVSNRVAAACLTSVVNFHQQLEIGLGICLRPSVLPVVDPRLLNYYLRPGKLLGLYDFMSGYAAEVSESESRSLSVLRYFTDISLTIVKALERSEGGFFVSENMTVADVLKTTLDLEPLSREPSTGSAT